MNKRRQVITLVLVVFLVAASLAANLAAGNTPALGLDLQGGASVTLQPDGEFDATGLDVAVEIIRARVDSIGVAEPEIILQGDTVVVNLPGVKDQQQALNIIGRTGELLLRPVLQSGIYNPDAATTTLPQTATTLPNATTSSSPGTSVPATGDSVEDGAGVFSGGPGASRIVSTPTTITDTTILGTIGWARLVTRRQCPKRRTPNRLSSRPRIRWPIWVSATTPMIQPKP